MTQEERVEKAMQTLRDYVITLAVWAGEGEEYGEKLWQGIRQSGGLLRELAYYHDYGKFLCEYKIAGYTLADVLVWQVDHFKLYMDRPGEMNSAFDTMLQMETDPLPFINKMESESGQDAANG